MADLKMVTEGELLSAGYSARTTNNRISDDYCPTVEFFMTGWFKEGYAIDDINNRDGYELFALSDISAEAKLMLFENDIVFNQGYEDYGTSEGFYVDAATSLTSFSIEMFYDANCTNSTNYSWSFTEDSNPPFTQNGITYRRVLFTGNAPYNNTNNERYLYFKITGYGIGISETDVLKVRQLDYNDVDPTWNLLYYGINFKYNEGPSSLNQFNVTDEANKGWILVYPDFMTLSPTGGTGNATITYYPKSTNETTTQRQGTLYLKSTDDNMSYKECMVTQDAKPAEKTSMIIHFNGMKTDLDYATNEYKYLYIWDNNAVLLKLGNDFNPSLSQKYVTITKDLITTLKQSSSSYENVTSEDNWKIVCSNMQNAEASDAAGFVTMANFVDVKNVIGAILTAWDNGNESVTITVSYREDVVVAYPTWNLTTASTLGLSSAGTDVNFTVTDNDIYRYSFSADSSGYFFNIYDNVGTKLDWVTQKRGTNDYTLRVNNNTGPSRSGHVYLVYDNQDNTDKIKNGVLVQQNAYVEQPKMGEVYSIYSNGHHSPTQLRSYINSNEMTANNITVRVEWAPDLNHKVNNMLIPIIGMDGDIETRIYTEWISGTTYRVHLKVRDVDISGATINASNLSSSNLCTIVHSITNSGKTHQISIENAPHNNMPPVSVRSVATSYEIRAGGVASYTPTNENYSYYGSVKLTVGSNTTLWKTWTSNGTICGWISTTDITQELKTASNYTPGPYKY